ncbi:FeoA family protein [Alkaliphilus transvaalensis]|uniref:FeoA family protein n=1 Tax=Alkaliphilus transvaalensis TaxID=114628 RepID=UPI00047982FD|nr:FeoA family protein [Alkaliphilus transvaalensis]
MSIYQLKRKNSCTIEKLPQIGLLKSLGLREGMIVNIMSKQPFGGPIVVQMGKRSIAIARNIAEQIQVREVN